jgi:hypothetical protein
MNDPLIDLLRLQGEAIIALAARVDALEFNLGIVTKRTKRLTERVLPEFSFAQSAENPAACDPAEGADG